MPALCYAKTAVPVVSAPSRCWGRRSWWAGGLSAVLLLSACGKTDAPGAGGPAARAMPQPEVGVVTVALRDVGLVTELPGRLEASRVAQVRARAAGILQKRLFREGSDVKAGQALFTIDAAPYAAALQSAQAQLAPELEQRLDESLELFLIAMARRPKPIDPNLLNERLLSARWSI